MADRLNLQDLLEKLLGSQEVYFQPPESVKMSYPAIRYTLSGINNDFANNQSYRQKRKYELIVMDYNPDGTIFLEVSQLPYCRFIRHYKKDNLNHYVFELYY